MMRLRLREVPGSLKLGRNMHCLRGHQRLTFVQENYHPGTALDIASGQGAFALWLHRQGCHVTMLDILPASSPAPGIEVIQMDLHDLQSHDRQYDTVVFMEAIEHVQDPEVAICLCYGTVAPGGVLLITTPWVADWDGETDHVWRFSLTAIEELLALYNARVWSDDVFVYAVVEKEDESAN